MRYILALLPICTTLATAQGWEWQNPMLMRTSNDSLGLQKTNPHFPNYQRPDPDYPKFTPPEIPHEGRDEFLARPHRDGETHPPLAGLSQTTDGSMVDSVYEAWVARYMGLGNSDAPFDLAVDGSGNVYVTGDSWSDDEAGLDYATIKYDASGQEQWVTRYNGPGDSDDAAYAIAVDGSGNVYVTGVSYSSDANSDYATIKYDPSGVQEWVARYDGGSYDGAFELVVDSSGNVYVTGQSWGSIQYDYVTAKYDASGAEQWVARYNGPGNSYDYPTGLAVDNSGNVYVAGLSPGSGTSYDYATIKYDASGVELWVARYNGPGNSNDSPSDLAIDGSGNVYVTGGSEALDTLYHYVYDYATIKYNPSGVQQWVARYNGPGNDDDVAVALAVDGSGNVYVTGGSDTLHTGVYATIKYDPSGTQRWVARYNGPGNGYDHASAIALDNSSNIYVTGYSPGSGTSYDYATIKYDASGAEQWVARYDGSGSYDYANALAVDGSGNVYVTGQSDGSDMSRDYATIKYQQNPASADPHAQFNVCYGATGSADLTHPGALITIDPATGAGTFIGPTGIIGDNGSSVPVLAIKSTGEIYALSASINSGLYIINASTGTGTFVAHTGLVSPDALAFNANDVLYSVANDDNLYTIDLTNGSTTLVGPIGFVVKALSYDPTDGVMYGSSSTDQIYNVDVTTGTSTLIGTTGLGGPTHALRFDQEGNLFGTKGSASNPYTLIAIDKLSGAGTTIGPIGFQVVLGLASRVLYAPPSIPCADITNMAARCIGGGTKTIQVRVNLLNNTIHAGEDITIAIDENQYTSTIITNGTSSRANFSVPGWSVGDHVVSLVDPPGCLADKHANCVAGDGIAKADPYWDDDAEWATSVQEVPQATTLLGNYPNPFNPSTTFRYGLSEPGQVSLTIYDMLGQLVKTIVNDYQSEGYHGATWEGRNESGANVSSGIYIYRMTAGNFVQTKRMLLLK